ncbi:MAG TPA: triple tyrosine motif-containing protein [Ferruginibacter sp.]|nr:triple tyrosine motif-containing protein [Ferruginibacter sp.]
MQNKISKLLALALVCLFCCSAFAQPQKKYLFARYGKVNGLVSDLCFSVVQDKQGYIWVATDHGLQRFDGKRFITFRRDENDPASLPSNLMGALHLDKKDRLWILFFGKEIGYLNTATFRYTPVKLVIPDEFRKSNMQEFLEDPDGTLHVAVLGYGVTTFNEKKNEFSAAHNVLRLKDGSNPMEINATKNKAEYLVTTKTGFEMYNGLTKKWTAHNESGLLKNMNRALTEGRAYGPGHIFTDRKNRIWADVWLDGKKEAGPAVYAYHLDDSSWHDHKKSVDQASSAYHSINGFLEQKDGTIWVHGTALLARFNEEKQTFEDIRNESLKLNGIEMETIFELFEDKDSNIWISSTNGLYMFNPGKQVFSNLPNRRKNDKFVATNSNTTDAVLQSRSGIIYSAAWGAGLFSFDSSFNMISNSIIPVIKDNYGRSIWDMHERANGEMWLSMQGGSVRIYSAKTNKTKELKLAVFETRTVRQVIEDSLGNIWMGTQYGLVIKCANANWQDTSSFKVVHSLKGRITKLVADSKGFVWVCTDRYGLYKLNARDGKIVAHYDDEGPPGQRLKIQGANDIVEFNDSIMLIASGELNVLNLNTNKITFVQTSKRVENNALATIIKDRQGYIWLAFSDGLCRMEYNKNIFLYFGPEDGILNNHFAINASTILNDGRILIGTSSDLLLFDPAKINPPKKAAHVNISGFKLADKELLVDSLLQLKKITLPYNNNSFTIDLTTFNYQNDFAIMYMLEGVDKKWLVADDNKITYTRLPPGNYIFKTKSISATGDESIPSQVLIDIVPPFWNTWWFYGLLILSGLAVFYLTDRERLLRIRATQKLRTDIAMSLHHEVNTELNNINLLGEMARMKVDKDIARSKDLIEQISEKSNDMMIAMDDMLWVIDPANDSMEKTLLRMSEFIDSLRNRHEADIIMQVEEKVKNLKLDMKLRHGFFIIFKTALRCTVQYSGARETLVNIDLQKNSLSLKMLSSAGLKEADTAISKYLGEMKTHAENINAELDIQTDKYETNIVLTMPVK